MEKKIDWTNVLRRAAKSGRNAILRNYDLASRRKVIRRGVGGDLTLRIDDVSERAIHESLKRDLGRDSFIFLSEEVGEIAPPNSDSLPTIICDPLDGSHNAQVGIPFFSLSLAVVEQSPRLPRTFGTIKAGLITGIKTQDEYFAVKGRGAYHNGIRLKPNTTSPVRIETLLVETGDIDFLRDRLIRKLTGKVVYKIRILGSAALSYCLLADGTAGAFIFAQPGGARTIDSPAGYLIAREAGCVFADLSGKVSNVDDVEVGFNSRIDMIGAPNQRVLTPLTKLVNMR